MWTNRIQTAGSHAWTTLPVTPTTTPTFCYYACAAVRFEITSTLSSSHSQARQHSHTPPNTKHNHNAHTDFIARVISVFIIEKGSNTTLFIEMFSPHHHSELLSTFVSWASFVRLSSSVELHLLPWAPPHPSPQGSSQCDKGCSCRLCGYREREGERESENVYVHAHVRVHVCICKNSILNTLSVLLLS